MKRIYVIIGKSASGKDTIAKRLLDDRELGLAGIVPYTTRPIREGEINGKDYFFTDQEKLDVLRERGKVIESRTYQTVYGDWTYFTVDDGQIDLSRRDSLTVGTLESYMSFCRYFGEERVLPIYIEVEDGERLERALQRERKEKRPKYQELCRRFLSDSRDFSDQKLKEAGIRERFVNENIDKTVSEIRKLIRQRT